MSIKLNKIKKRFGHQIVINNISLEIFNGELFVLLGSSGSGKSTLLRVIAGLIQPDAGKIEINEKDVTNLSPQQRNTGFVFQNYSVFRHMTVQDNIEFGLKIRKVHSEERKKVTADLLELVGLTGLEKRYADELSGGQQQRVALARALAYKPEVLLLDEPFGALDVKIRSQLRKSLKEIQNKIKVTTILVTHDQEEAFELSDRIGVINQGQLIEVDQPDKLYNYPKFEFTAAFIGGGNVLVGRKEKNFIRLGSTLLPFPEKAPPHDDNAPVRILFRPESVLLSTKKFTDDIYVLGRSKINEIKFNGSFFRLFLDVNELKGVQALEPRILYGQNTVRIEAVVPGNNITDEILDSNQEFWLGLKNFHVLEPTGLKLLIYIDHSSIDPSFVEFGFSLAQATEGFACLLSVVNSQSHHSETFNLLETIRQSHQRYLNLTSTNVRQGNYTEEILKEAQEGQYEMVILKWEEEPSEYSSKALQILRLLKLPLLLVKNPHPQIQRLLICTAAGEPGKEDIKFGGRVAKLTGAFTTLFHITRKSSSKAELFRAERHLLLGKATLEALNVKSEIKIEEDDNPVNKISSELQKGQYDLLIIGSPAPKTTRHLFWKDLTRKIIDVSNVPVLIVPMVNE